MYISAWAVYTKGLAAKVQQLFHSNYVNRDDVVWVGPSGDAIICADAGGLGEEYGDYMDGGLVEEYLEN